MRYLCPVCESELTGKFYCPDCKRLVREPWIYHGTTLPNETDLDRFSTFEDDCDHPHRFGIPNFDPHSPKAPEEPFVANARTASQLHSAKKTHQPDAGRVIPTMADPRKAAAQAAHKLESAGRSLAKGAPNKKIIPLIIIVIIYLAAMILMAIGSFVRSGVDHLFGSKSPVSDYYDGEEQLASEVDGPCTGYYHYPINQETFTGIFTDSIAEVWPEPEFYFTSEDDSFYESEGETYYEHVNYVSVTAKGLEADLCIVGDANTGEVMEVYVYCPDDVNFMKLCLLTEDALCDGSYDRSVLWQDVNGFFRGLETSDMVNNDWCLSELCMIRDEECYTGYFTCLPDCSVY